MSRQTIEEDSVQLRHTGHKKYKFEAQKCKVE